MAVAALVVAEVMATTRRVLMDRHHKLEECITPKAAVLVEPAWLVGIRRKSIPVPVVVVVLAVALHRLVTEPHSVEVAAPLALVIAVEQRLAAVLTVVLVAAVEPLRLAQMASVRLWVVLAGLAQQAASRVVL